MGEFRKTPTLVSWLRYGLIMVAAAALIACAIAIWAGSTGRLTSRDSTGMIIFCGVIAAVAAGTALTYTPGSIAGPMRPAGGERSLSWTLVSNVVVGLLWTGLGTMHSVDAFADQDLWQGYGYVLLVLGWLWLSPATLMGWGKNGKGEASDPDRELNNVFRARATASGFWALLACGAAAWLISLRSPNVLPYALPFGLWLGGSVACIHFVWLHHRAEREMDDDG